MPVGQPTSSTPTYLGRVITCDPTQRIVEVVLNASGQRLQIMTTPVCARWPMVGETWTVCFVNNTPYLGEPYQTYQIGSNGLQTGIEEIPAGDAWINSPTGVLHIIGSPNGSTDFTLSKISMPSWVASGDLTGTYPNPQLAPPRARTNAVSGSVPAGSIITVTTASWSLQNGMTVSGNGIVVPRSGYYAVAACITGPASSSTGYYQLYVAVNGVQQENSTSTLSLPTAAQYPTVWVTDEVFCTAGQTITITWQNSTGAAQGINQGLITIRYTGQ